MGFRAKKGLKRILHGVRAPLLLAKAVKCAAVLAESVFFLFFEANRSNIGNEKGKKRNKTKCGHVIKWKFPDIRNMFFWGGGRAVNLAGGNESSFHFFASRA